jgi:hypothetical protein
MDAPKVEAQTFADMQMERGIRYEQNNTAFLKLQARYNKDTQSLIEESKENCYKDFREYHLTLISNDMIRVENWRWYIVSNVNTSQYVTNDVILKGHIVIDQWREDYKIWSQERVPSKEEYENWINEKIDNVLNLLKDKYQAKCKELERPVLHHPTAKIVWAMPNKVIEKGNRKDAFIYSSNTPKKIVHIPFTDIHKQLIEANWVMQEGNKSSRNYLLAHLLFIVSDRPHLKEVDIKSGQMKYLGGRKFIDFPFVMPLNNLSETQIDKTNIGLYLGGSNYTGYHTEQSLVAALTKEVENIVSTLKAKFMLSNNDICDGFKVYSLCLFLNSIHNVCSNCEGSLHMLMNSREETSFLFKLESNLRNGLLRVVLPKSEQLRMCVTVSCHRLFLNKEVCSQILISNANDAFEATLKGTYKKGNFDVKELAGKVILSVFEKWVDGKSVDHHSRQAKLDVEQKKAKIPFYTGFVSGGYYETPFIKNKLEYDVPRFFDQLNIFGNMEDKEIFDKDKSLKRKRSFTEESTSKQEGTVTTISK